MVKVKVVSDRFINFGKQKDGKILFFKKDEPKEVELTEQIINAIETGLLREIKESQKEKPKEKPKKKRKGE